MKLTLNKSKTAIGLVAVAAFVSLPALVPETASASPLMQMAIDTSRQVQQGVNQAGGTGQPSLSQLIRDIVNILLFIIGIAAVIMIVVGGLRYVLSGGDSNSTKAAKDTVLYAVVGLVIAIMAYAIVNFVVGQF